MSSATCSESETDMAQDKQTWGDWTEGELNSLVIERLAQLTFRFPKEGEKYGQLDYPPVDFVLSEILKHEGFNRDKSRLHQVVDEAYNRWSQSQPGPE